MIFQFSKFSPKLLTYRWDTLYKSSFDIELRDGFAFLGYDFKENLVLIGELNPRAMGLRRRDNQILII